MVLIFDLNQKISEIVLPLSFSSESSSQSAANSNKVHESSCACTFLTLSSTLPSWGTAVHTYEKKKCQGKIFIPLRVIISSDMLVWDHRLSVF